MYREKEKKKKYLTEKMRKERKNIRDKRE